MPPVIMSALEKPARLYPAALTWFCLFHTLDRDAEPIECVALLPTGFEPSYAFWGT